MADVEDLLCIVSRFDYLPPNAKSVVGLGGLHVVPCSGAPTCPRQCPIIFESVPQSTGDWISTT